MASDCQNKINIVEKHMLSVDEFDSQFLKLGNPVVITGAIDSLPAKHWTLDILKEKAGPNKVYVRANTSTEEYRLGTKYNIRETTFGEYISDLQQGNHRSKNSYLAVQNIKKALPELSNDFEVPAYIGKVHGGPYLWIARKGHYEYCHYDPDDGMLVMLEGRKHVHLYGCDPDPLYPNPLGSKGRTVQSSVNCDQPDLEKHPDFTRVKAYCCVLEPGKMLYIPAFWWHQVSSIDLAISINIFWGNAGTNTFLTKAMNPPVWKAFSHWLLNVIEQNRSCPSFPKILGRLSESVYSFLYNQWHEAATEEQLEVLTQHIMDYLGITELPTEKNTGKHATLLQIRGLLWRS